MITADKLCYYSKLRFVNSTEKLIFCAVTLILCITGRSVLTALIIFTVMGYLTVGKGGIPLFHYVKLLSVPFLFLIISTLTVIVNFSETPLNAFAIPAGNYFITGSRAGICHGIQLICTASASISCLYFLSLNTPVPEILYAMKKLHFPPLLLDLMLLVYRYIFLILHLASDIMTAQKSRLGNYNRKTALRSFSSMITQVFILSIRRSGELFDAMEARCYDKSLQMLPESQPPEKKEIIGIIIFELLLFSLILGAMLRR